MHTYPFFLGTLWWLFQPHASVPWQHGHPPGSGGTQPCHSIAWFRVWHPGLQRKCVTGVGWTEGRTVTKPITIDPERLLLRLQFEEVMTTVGAVQARLAGHLAGPQGGRHLGDFTTSRLSLIGPTCSLVGAGEPPRIQTC